MNAIDAYLQGPPPGYALLISGKWGSGKSFTWKRYSNALSKPKPVTFSAAGLKTYADLENALFQASINDITDTPFVEAGVVLGRALLRFAKVNPSDIKLKAQLTTGKTVVCIDDVERFAGKKFETLFGFVVNLIDDDALHCILIADEDRAMAKFPDYGSYKERIIGKTIRLIPDIRNFCELTIAGFGSKETREQLAAGIEQIVDVLNRTKIQNLRTVRFLLTELDNVIRNLPATTRNPVTTSSLLSAMAFWVAATSDDLENIELVTLAFSREDLGMALALQKMNLGKGRADGEAKVGKLYDLLVEMGLIEEAHSWPKSETFISMVSGGSNVRFEDIASDFDLIDAQTETLDPLSVLNDYRSRADEEVQIAIEHARGTFFSAVPANLNYNFRVFRVLYYLSKIGIYAIEPGDFVKQALDRLNELLKAPEVVDAQALEIWPDSYNDDETKVISLLNEVGRAADEVHKIRTREKFIEALISGGDYPYDGTADLIFTDKIHPSELAKRIKHGGLPAVTRLRRVIGGRLRIQNAAQFVQADGEYAGRLAEAIEEVVAMARPMKILDAELRELAQSLRQFVSHVSEKKD